jgi:hypothetical protein
LVGAGTNLTHLLAVAGGILFGVLSFFYLWGFVLIYLDNLSETMLGLDELALKLDPIDI